jgi:hypothetical protein
MLSTRCELQIELVIDGSPSRRPFFRSGNCSCSGVTILAFAERDMRVKYKQTVLRIAWAVIQPLAFMVIFTLTIGRIAVVGTDDVPYAAFYPAWDPEPSFCIVGSRPDTPLSVSCG